MRFREVSSGAQLLSAPVPPSAAAMDETERAPSGCSAAPGGAPSTGSISVLAALLVLLTRWRSLRNQLGLCVTALVQLLSVSCLGALFLIYGLYATGTARDHLDP